MLDILIFYSISRNVKELTNNIKNNLRNEDYDFFNIKLENLQVFYRTKQKEYKNFIFNCNDYTLILIGEAFLRNDSVINNNLRKRKLELQEIAQLYNNQNEEIVKHIKGSYILLIFEKINSQLKMINNRFGITPFYYSFRNNLIILASSLKLFNILPYDEYRINELALVEKEIFNYMVDNKALIRNVYSLKPAEIISFGVSGFNSKLYWDVEKLYNQNILNEDEAIVLGEKIFKESVLSRVPEDKPYWVSLTGGFDGRTILSVLNSLDKVKFYSFGIENSLNITIPQKIAEELKLNYEPIILDKEYENGYPQFAEEMVLQSDCLRTIEGANYPYAFKKLSEYSDIVLTGIFGSELLRTFQNMDLMVTKYFIEINDSNNDKAVWDRIKIDLLNNSYLKKEIILKYFDEVRETFNSVIWDKIKHLDKNKRFYIYLIKIGLRNYFGGEIHAERKYAINRFPYLDDEFVEFIFKSPFAGVYSNALRPTPNQRFRAQYFYAKIIERNRPELLRYQTDHGYPAGYVLSKFSLFKIALPYWINSRIKKIKNYREFKPVEWGELYLKNSSEDIFLRSPYFNDKLKSDYYQKTWKLNYQKFYKAISFNIWLNR